MKHTDFLAWKSRLPSLTMKQRNQISIALKMLGVTETEQAQGTQEESWLTKGLFMALHKKLSCTQSEEYRIRHSTVFKQYLKIENKLAEQLALLIPRGGNTNARASLAYLVGVSLIEWCLNSPDKKDWYKSGSRWLQKPVTGIRVFERANQAMQALDAQFPGYIQANLFGLVFAAISSKGMKNGKAVSNSKVDKSVRTIMEKRTGGLHRNSN